MWPLASNADWKVFATFMVSNVSESVGYLKKKKKNCFCDICTQMCVMCLDDIRLLPGKTALKYMTWLMLVSSDYYILIFSAQFGEERPS